MCNYFEIFSDGSEQVMFKLFYHKDHGENYTKTIKMRLLLLSAQSA